LPQTPGSKILARKAGNPTPQGANPGPPARDLG